MIDELPEIARSRVFNGTLPPVLINVFDPGKFLIDTLTMRVLLAQLNHRDWVIVLDSHSNYGIVHAHPKCTRFLLDKYPYVEWTSLLLAPRRSLADSEYGLWHCPRCNTAVKDPPKGPKV